MNILLTTHSYLPNKDGVQFVNKYLCEGLVSKGHSVTVITYMYPQRTTVKEEFINGVKIIRWDAKTKNTFHCGDKKGYQNYVLNHYKEFDVMINVGTQTALTDWLLPILHKINIPKVLYLHSIWDFSYNKSHFSNIKAFISKIFANVRWRIYYNLQGNKFKMYDAVTQLHKMDYSTILFRKKYGIDSYIIENAAEKKFENVGEREIKHKYIINVSNYNSRKNQEKCLEYFYASNIDKEWELVLIGSDANTYYKKITNLNDNLRKKYRLSCNEKKVELLYGIDRNKIYEYVKNSSLYLQTSLWEAFPISLVESMAASVPFISSDVGIVKYLTGGVVAYKEEDFLYWIEYLTQNNILRKKLGQLGHQTYLERFKTEDKIDDLNTILNSIVKEKNK